MDSYLEFMGLVERRKKEGRVEYRLTRKGVELSKAIDNLLVTVERCLPEGEADENETSVSKNFRKFA